MSHVAYCWQKEKEKKRLRTNECEWKKKTERKGVIQVKVHVKIWKAVDEDEMMTATKKSKLTLSEYLL